MPAERLLSVSPNDGSCESHPCRLVALLAVHIGCAQHQMSPGAVDLTVITCVLTAASAAAALLPQKVVKRTATVGQVAAACRGGR